MAEATIRITEAEDGTVKLGAEFDPPVSLTGADDEKFETGQLAPAHMVAVGITAYAAQILGSDVAAQPAGGQDG